MPAGPALAKAPPSHARPRRGEGSLPVMSQRPLLNSHPELEAQPCLISCVTLETSFAVSEPQFFHLCNGAREPISQCNRVLDMNWSENREGSRSHDHTGQSMSPPLLTDPAALGAPVEAGRPRRETCEGLDDQERGLPLGLGGGGRLVLDPLTGIGGS